MNYVLITKRIITKIIFYSGNALSSRLVYRYATQTGGTTISNPIQHNLVADYWQTRNLIGYTADTYYRSIEGSWSVRTVFGALRPKSNHQTVNKVATELC